MRLRPAAAVAETGVIAALYAALTIVLNPISYGPLQLRLAEILKSLVVWEPHLIPAFVIGNFLGNLYSPFAGPWELLFMPFANLVGASACYVVGRRSPFAGVTLYALVISAAVSVVLSMVLKLEYRFVFPPLLASESVLIIGGVPIMQAVRRALAPVRRHYAMQ